MQTHDILIGVVIVLILSVQFAIFGNALKKINLFKNIIPKSESFKMVKVYIPESKIKSLTVDEILENEYLYAFKESDYEKTSFEVEEVINPIVEDDLSEDENFEDSVEYEPEYEEELDPDTEVWISKGNEEKKVPYRLLKSFELLGWQRI